MITVTNPGGSPSVVYNRDGVTIQTLASGAGPTYPNIVRYSGHTVVMNTTPGVGGIALPTDGEVGDILEVHGVGAGATVNLYPSTGFNIYQNGSSQAVVFGSYCFVLRLINATDWYVISQ